MYPKRGTSRVQHIQISFWLLLTLVNVVIITIIIAVVVELVFIMFSTWCKTEDNRRECTNQLQKVSLHIQILPIGKGSNI
jgi:hypothetical protein